MLTERSPISIAWYSSIIDLVINIGQKRDLSQFIWYKFMNILFLPSTQAFHSTVHVYKQMANKPKETSYSMSIFIWNKRPDILNIYNTIIIIASCAITLLSIGKLLYFKKNSTAKYLYWFIISANIVVLQLMLIDTKAVNLYPALLLVFIPFQFLSPVLFTAFTCSYLNKGALFKRYRYALLAPFTMFLIYYSFVKINAVFDYVWISKQTVAYVGAEFDENLAVSFSLLLGICNYRIIRNYENSLGSLPYQIVVKKTKWLKRFYSTLVVLCLLWACIILYIKADPNVGGHGPYYPLWLLFLSFYGAFWFYGSKHLKKVDKEKNREKEKLKEIAGNFQVQRLNRIFTTSELQSLQESQHDITGVLSYFASSLFDKNKPEDVLWSITGNCISQLNLEDCVIYILDKNTNTLAQKAAFGNKQAGHRKILSPLEIPLGKGIVGSVAKTGIPELIQDLANDKRYIEDDMPRMSELAVPIVHEGIILGVLDSEHSEKGFFEEKHLLLFQLIGKLTAAKLNQISKKATISISNENVYFKELSRLMEKELMYQDAELSLSSLSERLNISVTYLSQLVNTISNQNFSDFINQYRVRDAELKLTSPSYSNYTILGIGLEAGFNSKSAFYSAFKKHTGITPSEYREKCLILS
ncbi:helix-turn-helix domain-containing protein [Costertonia aggregata]|uniref:Helix-turn-helix domain-containing protein n=1 Tax=Costertonia aggregata TaxID=343403 RepID=A0A7H9AQ09_9FLAO|nr:helix-turn-helix domain-containing protein [Costertonia aggregata]QLG45335.1 helix-turn-helix domain-containing protein [Costertonia aggregata]